MGHAVCVAFGTVTQTIICNTNKNSVFFYTVFTQAKMSMIKSNILPTVRQPSQ